MRRQLASLIFAGSLAWCAPLLAAPPAVGNEVDNGSQTTVAVQRVSVPNTGVRDEAAMVLVGTVLIGLAAAVRRAA